MTTQEYLESIFPNLRLCRWEVTSDPDDKYNCIAWAVNWTKKPWWPNDFGFWPPGIPVEETIDAFVAAFATAGFAPCSDDSIEPGFEKIALYAQDNVPRHAARQLSDGEWTSKLGRQHDIKHERLEAVAGDIYGHVILFLKRQLDTA